MVTILPDSILQSEQVVLSFPVKRAVNADGEFSLQSLETNASCILSGRASPPGVPLRKYYHRDIITISYRMLTYIGGRINNS